MHKIIKIFILSLSLPSFCFAQFSRFIKSGTIEFEKSINMFAVLKDGYDPAQDPQSARRYDQYKLTEPQFLKQKSTLSFKGNTTLFVPEETNLRSEWGAKYPLTKQFNTVFTNLSEGVFVTQKDVFENLLILKDSARKIQWKITDEIREIMGFACRRANAVIMDSIYVVAFYTSAIPVSGGPESFHGLPGMILGLALPHDHITWFATKVTDTAVPESKVVAPQKGRLTNNAGLEEILKTISKNQRVNGHSIFTVFKL